MQTFVINESESFIGNANGTLLATFSTLPIGRTPTNHGDLIR